jgi:probable HAF family extracellular repeat protein
MRNIFESCRTGAAPFVVGLGLALLGAGAARAQELVRRYELIELTADNDAQSRAYAVNSTGQVVGWIEVGELHHSAQWHNRVTTDLHGTVHFDLQHPLFDQDYSEAYHISNGGQIVGTARTAIECPPTFIITNAFLLRPAVLTDLATPYPGDALANLLTLGNPCATAYDSAAVGISNSNYVVGWADRIDGVTHAFLVTPVDGQFVRDDDLDFVNDLMIDLGTLAASDPVSSATAVNDAGQVTGYSYTFAAGGIGGYHAFVLTPADTDDDSRPDQWFAGANGVNELMSDLGTLGGSNSWGRDINNASTVVGESDLEVADGQHVTHAFRWQGGTMTDLGTLHDDPRAGFSAASAVNANGAIVGWAENEQSVRRAFLYEDGRMTDLNTQLYLLNEDGSKITPGIVLTEARDINDDGVIVGWGTIKGSNGARTRGFLLNPIMVDPRVLEEEESDQTAGASAGSNSTGNPNYSSVPDFGPPDLAAPVADDEGTTGPTAAPAAPGLCGAQGLLLAPLMFIGLRRRRAK